MLSSEPGRENSRGPIEKFQMFTKTKPQTCEDENTVEKKIDEAADK